MSIEQLPIFVYGTLKRGEVREPMWPHPPTAVEHATTYGKLYDLGSYPALLAGDDLVAGELWYLADGDLAATLEALDRIECYGADDVDLYVRRIVECQTDRGATQRAFAYFLAEEQSLAGATAVVADKEGVCRWSRPLR